MGPPAKKHQPMTAAERARNYRMRIKQDPELQRVHQEKKRERYMLAKMTKKVKSIEDMSESERREQREKWRFNKSQSRKKREVSQIDTEFTNCSSPPSTNRNKSRESEKQEQREKWRINKRRSRKKKEVSPIGTDTESSEDSSTPLIYRVKQNPLIYRVRQENEDYETCLENPQPAIVTFNIKQEVEEFDSCTENSQSSVSATKVGEISQTIADSPILPPIKTEVVWNSEISEDPLSETLRKHQSVSNSLLPSHEIKERIGYPDVCDISTSGPGENGGTKWKTVSVCSSPQHRMLVPVQGGESPGSSAAKDVDEITRITAETLPNFESPINGGSISDSGRTETNNGKREDMLLDIQSPKPSSNPVEKPRPLTNAERQRNYRMRVKQNAKMLEAYQERARKHHMTAKMNKTIKCIDDMSESEKQEQREKWRIRKRRLRLLKKKDASGIDRDCVTPPLIYNIRPTPLVYGIRQANEDNNSGQEGAQSVVTCSIRPKQQVKEREIYIENPQSSVSATEVGGTSQHVDDRAESPLIKTEVYCDFPEPSLNETPTKLSNASVCSLPSHEIKEVVGYPENCDISSSSRTSPAENGGARWKTISLCSSPKHTMLVLVKDSENRESNKTENADGKSQISAEHLETPKIGESISDSESTETYEDNSDEEDSLLDLQSAKPSLLDGGRTSYIQVLSNISQIQEVANNSRSPGVSSEKDEGINNLGTAIDYPVPPDKKAYTVKKRRPLTAAERVRNYRMRIRQNPKIHKAYQEKKRERYKIAKMNNKVKLIEDMSESERREQREKWRLHQRQSRRKKRVSQIGTESTKCSSPKITCTNVVSESEKQDQRKNRRINKREPQRKKEVLPIGAESSEDSSPPLTYRPKHTPQIYKIRPENGNHDSCLENAQPAVTCKIKQEVEEDDSYIENTQYKSATEVGEISQTTDNFAVSLTHPPVKTEEVSCEYPDHPGLPLIETPRMSQNPSTCSLPSREIKERIGYPENCENKWKTVAVCSSPQHKMLVFVNDGENPGSYTADNDRRMTRSKTGSLPLPKSPKVGEWTSDSESSETYAENSNKEDLLLDLQRPEPSSNPVQKPRPLTSAERQRNYRMRVKQNAKTLEAYQERARKHHMTAKMNKTIKCIDEMSESEKQEQREKWRIRKRRLRLLKKKDCSPPSLIYNIEPTPSVHVIRQKNEDNRSCMENDHPAETCIKFEEPESCMDNSQSSASATEVGGIGQAVDDFTVSPPIKIEVVWKSESPEDSLNDTYRELHHVSACSLSTDVVRNGANLELPLNEIPRNISLPSNEIKERIGYPENCEISSSNCTSSVGNGGKKWKTVSVCSSPQHKMLVSVQDGENPGSSTAHNVDRMTRVESETLPHFESPKTREFTSDSEDTETYEDKSDKEDSPLDFRSPEPSSNYNNSRSKILLPSNNSEIQDVANISKNSGVTPEKEEGTRRLGTVVEYPSLPEKKTHTVKNWRPMTPAERARLYRMRMKQNPEAFEAYLEKSKQRYKMAKLTKKLKSIEDMNESEKREQRKQWRINKRNSRNREEVSQIGLEFSSPPVNYRLRQTPLVYRISQDNEDNNSCPESAQPAVSYNVKQKVEESESCMENLRVESDQSSDARGPKYHLGD